MLKRNEELIRTKLWQYLLPSIMLTAALQIGNVVDSMLVGQLIGSQALGAVKIGMTIDNIMEIPGYVLGVGGSVAVGILLGQRKREKANKVFSVTLTVSIICGLIFSLLSLTSPFLAHLLTNGNSLQQDVESFIFVTLLCAPILSVSLQFINYVAVDNNPTVASVYVIVANIINLGLDYVLLKAGLGTAGAALSTALGYGIAMLILIVYIKSKKRMLKFVNPFKNANGSLMLALKTGLPTLFFMIFITIKDIAINTLVTQLISVDAMSVYTVCANIVLVSELVTGGIIATIGTIGGVIYGEKDYYGVKALVSKVLKYTYIVLALLLLVLYIFTDKAVNLFGINGGNLESIAVFSLRIFIVCLPLYILNKFFTTYYQTIEKTKISSIITSLQNFVVIIPIAFILVIIAKNLQMDMLNALMISFVLSELITYVISAVYRRIKYSNQSILLLPKVSNDCEYDVSLRSTLENASRLPREIIDFCNNNNIDPSKSNKIAVAAEEMVVNIIKYGGKKATIIDVNLTKRDNILVMRLRDNGIPFDPTEYSCDKDNFEINGIEIIKKITDKIHYMRVLDLNNTVVEVSL